MRFGVIAAIDGRLEDLIVAWLRRRWPVLGLVPSRWLRPATRPAAVRLRGSLSRAAVTLAMPAAVALAVVLAVAP
jgi:hypothetical protein